MLIIWNKDEGPVTPFRASYTGFLHAWIFQYADNVLQANRYFVSFVHISQVGCKVPACPLRVFYIACMPQPGMALESCMLDMDNICAWKSWNTDKCTFDVPGPLYWHRLTSIPAWISNSMPGKMWDEIAYTFPNSKVLNGPVEIKKLISNFIPIYMYWM